VRSKGRLDVFTYVYVYVVIQLLVLELLRYIELFEAVRGCDEGVGGFCVLDFVELG